MSFLPRAWLVLSVSLWFAACVPARAPVPPGMIPQAKPLSLTDEQYGHQVLQAMTDRFELDYNNPRGMEVQDIVDRLTKAAGADKDPWHIYIFKDESVKNAAATRGNHVFVWTGMLNAALSQDELSTVLAHEIAHILAGHTDPDPNEEIKELLINIGAMAAGIAVSAATRSPSWGQNLGNLTSSVTQELGNGILLYPYSRDKEREADQIGLFMMADAKFNPNAAIAFWTKIPHDPDYREGPSFLSTHPPAEERLGELNQLLPQAMARFEGKSAPPPPWTPGTPGSPQGNSRTPVMTGPPAGSSTGGGLRSPGSPPPSGPIARAPGGISSPATAPIELAPSDTFDIGRKDTSSTSLGTWTVSSKTAVLYQSPTTKGRKIGEFRQGAKVKVGKKDGAWLEIFEPDHGYLRAADVTQ